MLAEDVIKLSAMQAALPLSLKCFGIKIPIKYPHDTSMSPMLIHNRNVREVVRRSLHLRSDFIITHAPRSEKHEKHDTRILFGRLDA